MRDRSRIEPANTMNRIPPETQAMIAALLAEGNTLRGVSRLLRLTPNKVTYNSVCRNAFWIGNACQRFHDENVHGLGCPTIQTDEAHSFIYGKGDTGLSNPIFGTCWTWVSIDPDTRFVVNWHLGGHNASDAAAIMNDLARRIPGRLQIHTDQLRHYYSAVQEAFGARAAYATTRKDIKAAKKTPDGQFEQGEYEGERVRSEFGNPDMDLITTTSVESQNTRLRKWNSRYTRRTIAFSKKLANMKASLALHFVYCNFCRSFKTPDGVVASPAMRIGLADRVWKIEALMEKINVDAGRELWYLNETARKTA